MGLKTIIATIVLKTISFLFDWIKDIRAEARDIKTQENISRFNDLSDALETIRTKTEAIRVFMIRCNNSGKVVKPGVQWFGTITEETWSKGYEPAKPNFQNVWLDDDYKRVIIEMGASGFVGIERSKVKEGSQLADIFDTEGVSYAQGYKIKYREKMQHFLVIQFPEGGKPNVNQKRVIEGQVGVIRKAMA